MRFETKLVEGVGTLSGEPDGVLYVQYTPVLDEVEFIPCAHGKLTFSCWCVPVGSPLADHEQAKQDAWDNVKKVMARWLQQA